MEKRTRGKAGQTPLRDGAGDGEDAELAEEEDGPEHGHAGKGHVGRHPAVSLPCAAGHRLPLLVAALPPSHLHTLRCTTKEERIKRYLLIYLLFSGAASSGLKAGNLRHLCLLTNVAQEGEFIADPPMTMSRKTVRADMRELTSRTCRTACSLSDCIGARASCHLYGRVMHSPMRLHRSKLFHNSAKSAPRSPTITKMSADV